MNQPATRVRYAMIAGAMCVAVMLYVDRVCLSILSEQIKPLLGENPTIQKLRFADLTSAFFWSYALCQLPAGWLGDRFGARSMLALYFLLWSVCTGLTGFASGFATLFLLRLGCGAFEAGAYPLAAAIVRRWVPREVRGFASACVAVGGRLGGAIAPPLTIAIAGTFIAGWRVPFFVYGVVGIVGAIIFWWGFRDRPDEHPAVNAAELELIKHGQSIIGREEVGFPPVSAFLVHPGLWLNSLLQFLANFAWVFIITLFPEYLQEVFSTPESTRAVYQSYPLYAGIIGMLLGGWLTDQAMQRLGPRWGRGLPVAGSRLIVGAAYLACVAFPDPIVVTLMMCIVALATDLGAAPVWAWAQDVGGKHTGSVVGWANMWGNFGAALAPIIIARVRQLSPDDASAGWASSFLLCAAVQLVAAVAALGLDTRRLIVHESNEQARTQSSQENPDVDL